MQIMGDRTSWDLTADIPDIIPHFSHTANGHRHVLLPLREGRTTYHRRPPVTSFCMTVISDVRHVLNGGNHLSFREAMSAPPLNTSNRAY